MRLPDPVGVAAMDVHVATPSRGTRLPGLAMAGFRARAGHRTELAVVPHPAVTVFVDLGDSVLVADAAGRRQRGSVVTGPAPGTVLHGTGQAFECLQLRLSPVLAHAVLGAVPSATATLDELWGRAAATVRERLCTATSWPDRFAIAETALLHRYRPVHPDLAFAWQRLVRDQGRTRVHELAAELGWTRTRLWSRFRTHLGLTPKHAARLIRFDHAVHHLAAGHSPATVAADTGYADQSHLHRDVLAFTGTTPATAAAAPWLAVDPIAWPRNIRPIPNHP